SPPGPETGPSGLFLLPAATPQLYEGGTVQRTGVAVVHQGETIVPGSIQAQAATTVQSPGFTPTATQPVTPPPHLGLLLGISGGVAGLALLSSLLGHKGDGNQDNKTSTDSNTSATDQNSQALQNNTGAVQNETAAVQQTAN